MHIFLFYTDFSLPYNYIFFTPDHRLQTAS